MDGYLYFSIDIVDIYIFLLYPRVAFFFSIVNVLDCRIARKRAKRHTEGREERPMFKGQTREEWRSAVFQGSLKAEKPWEAMGISRRTYYRRKNGK